jgi:hypothetical protein
MSKVNALWLATALWLLAVVSVAVVFGVSTWGGGLMLVSAGAVPLLIAHRLWRAPAPSLSQDIQRELR